MAALEGKAASGFAKLQTDFLFEDLPAERSDPLWTKIRTEYSLTLAELSALQNARCQQGNKKAASGFAKLPPDFLFEDLPPDSSDIDWVRIENDYGLSFPEIRALKNARCQQAAAAQQDNTSFTDAVSKKMRHFQFQTNGISIVDKRHIPRVSVMEKLNKLVNMYVITLMSSPPATGKSSLLQLFSAQNSTKYKISYIQCREGIYPHELLRREGIDLEKMEFDLPQDQWTLIIIDDAQHCYDFPEFWHSLLKSPGWCGKNNSRLKFIISATHAISINSSSPEGFQSLPRISFDDLKISIKEADELIGLNFNEMHFTLSEKVREMIIHQSGGVIGAVSLCVMKIVEKFFQRNNIAESAILQFFCSREYIEHFDRVFGTNRDPVHADFEVFLKNRILFDKSGGTDSVHTEKLIELEKRGVLAKTNDGLMDFSSVLAERYYSQYFFPNRADSCPENLLELIKLAIRNMSGSLLTNSVVKATHFPKEAVFQHEFMSGLARSLPAIYHICPELSHKFPSVGGAATTSEKVNGEIDFYINGKLHWGLELLIKGDRIKEHLSRFEVGGKYYDFGMKDYRVIDFRFSADGNPTWVDVHENKITVFFAEGDFSKCTCICGTDETHVEIDLLP